MSKSYDEAFREPDPLKMKRDPKTGNIGVVLPRENGSQPAPIPNEYNATWALVISDMAMRHNVGVQRYGTPLQPFNGRNSLQDLYEELLDGCCYIKNAIIESEKK